jgi:iron(III) transport system ATP-binding protein
LKKNLLNLKEVHFEVNSNLILKDVNLDIDEGNFVSIIGKSGSGKTTLLKIISGLKKQTKGTIILNDKILSNDNIFVEPEDRKLGLVVQEKVLFPHLNVQANVEFGITSDDKKNEKCIEMLKKFHISNLTDKYPHEISGGEAQRVALARTLVTKPSVLLLDEPFNGLDQGLKNEIYPDIKKILKENKMTTIMVSHDLSEVKSLSNKIYELNNATLKTYES